SAHAAFADLLDELVGADDAARTFARSRGRFCGSARNRPRAGLGFRGALEKAPQLLLFAQQLFDLLAQCPIISADLIQKCRTSRRIILMEGSNEDVAFVHGSIT